MQRTKAGALFLFAVALVMAKDHPKVKIQVMGSEASERHYTQFIPGTNGRSSTNCYGNATATSVGNTTTADGSSNCYTTTTPGRAPSSVTRSIPQVHVRAVMPDGLHVTLWCQAGFRHCENLSADLYDAELDGNSVWIYSSDLSGKSHKVKYRYVGGW
jgi:hypothetical protein